MSIYLGESALKFLEWKDSYRANQFEIEAYAMEAAMKDILKRHPDLFKRVPGRDDAYYEIIAKEIREAYLKALEAERKKHGR